MLGYHRVRPPHVTWYLGAHLPQGIQAVQQHLRQFRRASNEVGWAGVGPVEDIGIGDASVARFA